MLLGKKRMYSLMERIFDHSSRLPTIPIGASDDEVVMNEMNKPKRYAVFILIEVSIKIELICEILP